MNNTDAEGRLVLGDGVSNTSNMFCRYCVMAVQFNIFIEVSESMLINLIILLHIFSRFDSLDISNFIFLFIFLYR